MPTDSQKLISSEEINGVINIDGLCLMFVRNLIDCIWKVTEKPDFGSFFFGWVPHHNKKKGKNMTHQCTQSYFPSEIRCSERD